MKKTAIVVIATPSKLNDVTLSLLIINILVKFWRNSLASLNKPEKLKRHVLTYSDPCRIYFFILLIFYVYLCKSAKMDRVKKHKIEKGGCCSFKPI